MPFSDQKVIVEVRGPDCVDVTLVDLPGLIQAHATHKGMPKLVEDLTVRQIRRPNTRILMCLDITAEMENQGRIVDLVKQNDPGFQNTTIVFSKADLLQPARLSQTIAILKGDSCRDWNIAGNFYLLRNPGPEHKGWALQKNPLQNATELEQRFFADRKNQVARRLYSNFSAVCGCDKLRKNISAELTKKALQVLLPTLKAVEKLKAQATKRLQELGANKNDAQLYQDVRNSVMSNANDIASDVTSSNGRLELKQRLHNETTNFLHGIRHSRPALDPTWSDANLKQQDTFSLADSDDGKEDGGTSNLALPATASSSSGKKDDERAAAAEPNSGGYEATVGELVEILDQRTNRSLLYPGVNSAVENVVCAVLKRWPHLAADLLVKTHDVLRTALLAKIKRHFGKYESEALIGLMTSATNEFLDDCFEQAVGSLGRLIRQESKMRTRNDHYLTSNDVKYTESLTKALLSDGTRKQAGPKLMKVLTATEKRAVALMAKAQAYHHVAEKRFVDNVRYDIIGCDILDRFKTPGTCADHEATLMGEYRDAVLQIGVGVVEDRYHGSRCYLDCLNRAIDKVMPASQPNAMAFLYGNDAKRKASIRRAKREKNAAQKALRVLKESFKKAGMR